MGMNRGKLIKGAMVLAAVALAAPAMFAADATMKTISDVMKKAHKGKESPAAHAGAGKATKAELDLLMTGYQVMLTQDPPKGDKNAWKTKVQALITATQGLQQGKPDAAAAYKKAVNCKACHNEHQDE